MEREAVDNDLLPSHTFKGNAGLTRGLSIRSSSCDQAQTNYYHQLIICSLGF